jgi:hypothetical protein|tara:strand:+ start:133 stop:612 length:480 start_codon:yes stop_codon:yes gene_type:complete
MGGRYILVEGPDGCVAIAFNQEIPQPVIVEPPEEIQTPIVTRFDLDAVKYNKIVQLCFQMALLISLFNLVTSQRIFDVINIIFTIASTFAVHSERPISIALIMGHCMYLITILRTIAFMHRWWDLSYVISYTVLCIISLLTMKKTLGQSFPSQDTLQGV